MLFQVFSFAILFASSICSAGVVNSNEIDEEFEREEFGNLCKTFWLKMNLTLLNVSISYNF